MKALYTQTSIIGKLKSYYFTLNESKIALLQWLKNMVRIALSIIPKNFLNI